MAKDKKGFILYADYLNVVKDLTDKEAGKLFKHILEYVNDLNPEASDRLTKVVFEPIKMQLKRDLKKYEDIRVKRSEAGKRGVLSKIQQNEAKQANAEFAQAKQADTVICNNVTVTDNVINIKEKIFFKINTKSLTVPVSDWFKSNYQIFLEDWCMKHGSQKLNKVLMVMDTRYHSHVFTSENHVKNAFMKAWEELPNNLTNAIKKLGS